MGDNGYKSTSGKGCKTTTAGALEYVPGYGWLRMRKTEHKFIRVYQ